MGAQLAAGDARATDMAGLGQLSVGQLMRERNGEALERAIGVIYRPQTELLSHYFHARLGKQFDAVIHMDETHAVQPLERTREWEREPLTDPNSLGELTAGETLRSSCAQSSRCARPVRRIAA